jgi:hypothetical protein
MSRSRSARRKVNSRSYKQSRRRSPQRSRSQQKRARQSRSPQRSRARQSRSPQRSRARQSRSRSPKRRCRSRGLKRCGPSKSPRRKYNCRILLHKNHKGRRPSPARAASDPACHFSKVLGNDGKRYQSLPNRNYIFRWVPI